MGDDSTNYRQHQLLHLKHRDEGSAQAQRERSSNRDQRAIVQFGGFCTLFRVFIVHAGLCSLDLRIEEP
ncbi:hypothetical protein RvY_10934 [Ramazzottius varieornatus]|uniref:Uncharacterized protein n=1 Tax=Ramazzottius varieornatus TaxID=947166 RepID=A0A1D1VEE4_RAMVA|nr:hypothetical protein RvY_10934 [Ramazzottius varieornatus]